MRRSECSALLLVVGLFAAANGEDEKAQSDHDRIQGTWKTVSAERDGKALKGVVGHERTFDGRKLK